MFDRQHFLDFKSGDEESYELLVKSLGRLKFARESKNNEIFRMIPFDNVANLFMNFEGRVLPGWVIEDTAHGPLILLRLAIERAAHRNFSYGKKTFLKTSMLTYSILYSLNHYFTEVKRIGHRRAYRSFQILVNKEYRLRELFFNHHLDILKAKKINYAQLLGQVKKIKLDRKLIQARGLGHFVLNIVFYCGIKFSSRDQKQFHRLQKLIQNSPNMSLFLQEFLRGPGLGQLEK